jgi:hypothetical protein
VFDSAPSWCLWVVGECVVMSGRWRRSIGARSRSITSRNIQLLPMYSPRNLFSHQRAFREMSDFSLLHTVLSWSGTFLKLPWRWWWCLKLAMFDRCTFAIANLEKLSISRWFFPQNSSSRAVREFLNPLAMICVLLVSFFNFESCCNFSKRLEIMTRFPILSL